MAAKEVLAFLEEHNRPYSVLDIQNGVKGEFGKSAVQKAVDSLVEKERVKEKIYGKQKVYFISQDTNTSPRELTEQILVVDRKINEVLSNLKEKSNKIKENMGQYEEVKGKMSLPEACEKKVELETELRGVKDALKEYNGIDPVTPEVKKTIEAKYEKYLGTYKKRKRMCLDMLDAILENYPKSKKHLYEDIGIETDEDAGFAVLLSIK